MERSARFFAPFAMGLFFLGSERSLAQQDNIYSADPSYYEPAPAVYEVQDPWEDFNRSVYAFNEKIDRYALKPVAQAYLDWVPSMVSTAVTNFFSNLEEPINFLNNLLQLKGEGSLISGGRFAFNSTFGLGGLIDVATGFGLPKQEEDFGQTLGYWGIGSGPFLVLPFIGPSSVRDSGSLLVDTQVPNGYEWFGYPETYYLLGLRGVDLRARLIPAERSLIGSDRYRAIRNAYTQRREFLVNDGRVDDPFAGDEDMLDDF